MAGTSESQREPAIYEAAHGPLEREHRQGDAVHGPSIRGAFGMIKLVPVGFFGEMAHADPPDPSIADGRDDAPGAHQEMVAAYLAAGQVYIATPGIAVIALDGVTPIGPPHNLTDGIHVWPRDAPTTCAATTCGCRPRSSTTSSPGEAYRRRSTSPDCGSERMCPLDGPATERITWPTVRCRPDSDSVRGNGGRLATFKAAATPASAPMCRETAPLVLLAAWSDRRLRCSVPRHGAPAGP
jgi:hypothetical protein